MTLMKFLIPNNVNLLFFWSKIVISRRLCRMLCGHSKINLERVEVRCSEVLYSEVYTVGWAASSTGRSSSVFQLPIFQAKPLMAKRARGRRWGAGLKSWAKCRLINCSLSLPSRCFWFCRSPCPQPLSLPLCRPFRYCRLPLCQLINVLHATF